MLIIHTKLRAQVVFIAPDRGVLSNYNSALARAIRLHITRCKPNHARIMVRAEPNFASQVKS